MAAVRRGWAPLCVIAAVSQRGAHLSTLTSRLPVLEMAHWRHEPRGIGSETRGSPPAVAGGGATSAATAVPTGHLVKEYAFRDPATANRFELQVRDLRVACLFHVTGGPGGVSRRVAIALPAMLADGTEGGADVASAVDDVAAELQLAGKWN